MIPPFDVQQVFVLPWTRDGAMFGWILLMGILVAVPCGLLGSFLVLRRMALLGDAVSHAVLPGLVLAFLFSGSRAALPMWIGAALAGVVASVLIEGVHRRSRVKQDASIGIVLTVLFALGVVLISLLADRVDLDQDCVLYGEIAWVPLQPWILGLGPGPVVTMGLVCLAVLAGVLLFYKGLLVTSFDPGLAVSLGLRTDLYHYGLMAALSVTVVSAFESVGAILVVAMLILPAATAYMLTDRLPRMLALSALHGVLSAALGLHLSIWLDSSIAGAMVVAGTGLFGLAFLFAPVHGIVPKAVRRARLRTRIAEENLLATLQRRGPERVPVADLHGPLRALRRRGLVEVRGAEATLTPAGVEAARRVVRAHRLWEAYMAGVMNLPADHLHDTAHTMEHVLDPALLEQIEEKLGHPGTDPHGSEIPR